jgi:hypothetical protein
MRVLELWRYPVKSLQGERVPESEVGPRGLTGDRGWALFDLDTGFGLTARRAAELLHASARLRPDGTPEIVLPGGAVARGDGDLSDWLGRRVGLRSADEVAGERRYESPTDAETEASWGVFSGSRGAFHDSGRAAVTLVSTAVLDGRDPRRFRANVVLDGAEEDGVDEDRAGEDGLVGRSVRLGTAELRVVEPVARCVMVTRSQPGGLPVDREVLRRVHRERGGVLSVGAVVARAGLVRVGDPLVPLGPLGPPDDADGDG